VKKEVHEEAVRCARLDTYENWRDKLEDSRCGDCTSDTKIAIDNCGQK